MPKLAELISWIAISAIPTSLRIHLSSLTLIACLCAVSLSAHAIADTPKQVNVPAGELSVALQQLATQSGVEFVYSAEQLKGVRTHGVRGEYTTEKAVIKLLEGTKLKLTIHASGALLISGGAPVQNSDGESKESTQSTQLEEIVVTAQKRMERLIDVPMAITAVTGVEIERRGVSSLQRSSVFSARAIPGAMGPGQERIQIRGVSTSNGLPTVGQYLDEMPISIDDNTQSLGLRLIDMERIEVLRGPQGTLYGEGSMGGTIRYLTAKPDLTRFGGSFEAQAGAVTDGDTAWRVNGVVNLPVVKDRAGLRVVAGYEDTGGWIDSLVTGQENVNAARIFTIREQAPRRHHGHSAGVSTGPASGSTQEYQIYGKDRQSVLPFGGAQ